MANSGLENHAGFICFIPPVLLTRWWSLFMHVMRVAYFDPGDFQKLMCLTIWDVKSLMEMIALMMFAVGWGMLGARICVFKTKANIDLSCRHQWMHVCHPTLLKLSYQSCLFPRATRKFAARLYQRWIAAFRGRFHGWFLCRQPPSPGIFRTVPRMVNRETPHFKPTLRKGQNKMLVFMKNCYLFRCGEQLTSQIIHTSINMS